MGVGAGSAGGARGVGVQHALVITARRASAGAALWFDDDMAGLCGGWESCAKLRYALPMTLDRPRSFAALMLCALSLCGLAGCPAPDETLDAATLDTSIALDARGCVAADDCDDGVACNGSELCEAGRCRVGNPIRCDDGIACTTDTCSEALRGCMHRAIDADGDGSASLTCVNARGEALGSDCDDDDRLISPGALEVCDAGGRDEDCDPATYGGIDFDGDGFEDARCCNGTSCGTDCNDALQSSNPLGTEACNGVDDDCDGMIDEGVRISVYPDRDGDGRGVTAGAITACASTPGYSLFSDDCDDANRMNSPVLPEVCDGRDNDCDGVPDPADITVSSLWYLDSDGDGFGNPASSILSCTPPMGAYSLLGTDCNDGVAAINPAQAEQCNGIDDDCNGAADFAIAAGDLEDDDRDGNADSRCTPLPVSADCDDRDATSGPGGTESCDGRDNDCDSRVDEAVATLTYFRDLDGDGYGSESSGAIVGCVPVLGHARRGGDCDDASITRHPNAPEACNGTDEDCDRSIDEAPADDMCASVEGSERTCRAGMCRPLVCAPGFADCVDDHDGCETFTDTSIVHCGRCGSPCASEPNANAPRCAFGGCAALTCAPGFNDCDGNLGSGGNGCETNGSCGGGGCGVGPACAEDQDCIAGGCVPCTPAIVPTPGGLAPPRPAGLVVSCFDGPESFVNTDCPVVHCGRLVTWPFSYTDNRFSLGLTTYRDDGTFLRSLELMGPRYVWAMDINAPLQTNTYRGQHDDTAAVPWSVYRNP